MRPRPFTLITNEQYLEKLEDKLSKAQMLRDETAQSKNSKSALYTEKLTYKVKLNDTFGKLKVAEANGKKINQALENGIALSNFTREKIGFTLQGLGSLAADIYQVAESTESLIDDIKKMIAYLEKVENAEELKANLDKLLVANEEALVSALATLAKTMKSYQDLLQLAAFFPEPRRITSNRNYHIDSLGDVTHSVRYMKLEMRDYLERFDDKLGTDSKGKVKDEDEDLFDILKHNLGEAEKDANACLNDLNKKDREFKDADASFNAIKASLDAAKAANGAG